MVRPSKRWPAKKLLEAGFRDDPDLGWCHPDGDAVGNGILRGEIPFAQARADALARQHCASSFDRGSQEPSRYSEMCGPVGYREE